MDNAACTKNTRTNVWHESNLLEPMSAESHRAGLDGSGQVVAVLRTGEGNPRKKGFIDDPGIFKGDDNNTKKNQENFLMFTAQVELKMTGDKDYFLTESERIIYVASRISGPAYKNIKSWVTLVVPQCNAVRPRVNTCTLKLSHY
jgi:hypothetical protein